MTISRGQSRLISFELGAREAGRFRQLLRVMASGCRAYRSLVVGLLLSAARLSTTGIHRSAKPVPFTGANLAPASVFALLVCALQTAGENDNSEIGYLNEE